MQDLNSVASIYCPYCHKHTALSVAKASSYFGSSKNENNVSYFNNQLLNDIWWMGVCNSCYKVVLVNDAAGKNRTIIPTPLPNPIHPSTPLFLHADLMEVKKCVGVGANRAACVLSRRLLQLICFDKQASKANLVAQITELKDRGILTNDMVEWATSVRFVGNDAAHPDKNQPVITRDDAEDILNLVEQIIHILYIAPQLAQAKKTKFEKLPSA